MHDILQVFARFRDSAAALQAIHLVENSSKMQELQRGSLEPLATKNGWSLFWHDAIEDVKDADTEASLDDMHTVVVANEFFDALPIHILEVINPFYLQSSTHHL